MPAPTKQDLSARLETIEGLACSAESKLHTGCTDNDLLEAVAIIEEECAALRGLVALHRRLSAHKNTHSIDLETMPAGKKKVKV